MPREVHFLMYATLAVLAILALLVLYIHGAERMGPIPLTDPWNNVRGLKGTTWGKWRKMQVLDVNLYGFAINCWRATAAWVRKNKHVLRVCGPNNFIGTYPYSVWAPVAFRGGKFRAGTTRDGQDAYCFDFVANVSFRCFGNPSVDENGKHTYPYPTNIVTRQLHIGYTATQPKPMTPFTYELIFVDEVVANRTRASSMYTGTVLMALPVEDLYKPKAGVWNAPGGELRGNVSKGLDGTDPYLEVSYPEGSQEGASWSRNLAPQAVAGVEGQGVDAIVLTFDVFLDENFEFVDGGKLFGGLHWGGEMASGLQWKDDGGSFRVVWKTDGAVNGYAYLPERNNAKYDPEGTIMTARREGEGGIHFFAEVFGPNTLKRNEWNHIELGMKLNTSEEIGDGMIMLTVNETTATYGGMQQVTSPDGTTQTQSLYLRVGGQPLIHELIFNTFFGGNWVSATDCFARFKNVTLNEWVDPPIITM